MEKKQISFQIEGKWYAARSPKHFYSFVEREYVNNKLKDAFRQYRKEYPSKVEARP